MKTFLGTLFILIGIGAAVAAAGIYERDRYFEWEEMQLPVMVAVVFGAIGIGVILEERRRRKKAAARRPSTSD